MCIISFHSPIALHTMTTVVLKKNKLFSPHLHPSLSFYLLMELQILGPKVLRTVYAMKAFTALAASACCVPLFAPVAPTSSLLASSLQIFLFLFWLLGTWNCSLAISISLSTNILSHFAQKRKKFKKSLYHRTPIALVMRFFQHSPFFFDQP